MQCRASKSLSSSSPPANCSNVKKWSNIFHLNFWKVTYNDFDLVWLDLELILNMTSLDLGPKFEPEPIFFFKWNEISMTLTLFDLTLNLILILKMTSLDLGPKFEPEPNFFFKWNDLWLWPRLTWPWTCSKYDLAWPWSQIWT